MRLAVSRKEVPQLFQNMESSERSRRERALDRLLQVEPPVRVEELEDLWRHKDVETRRITLRLITALQEKYGRNAVRVNGLEFLPCVDLVWRSPVHGIAERPVALALKVTNIGNKTLRYFEAGSPGFRLWDADGELVKMSCCADGIGPNFNGYSRPLKPGDSRTSYRLLKDAYLGRSRDDNTLCLTVRDGIGMYYTFSRLTPGRYYLSFECSCPGESAIEEAAKSTNLLWLWGLPPKDGVPLWRGEVNTPIIAVEIK